MSSRGSVLGLAIFCLVFLAAALAFPSTGCAQTQPSPGKVKIDWADGPLTARLGDIAEIRVPAGYRFAGKEGTRQFLELTQNPPSGNELGTIIPAVSGEKDGEFWFLLFEFNDVGYVKDDDRNSLDSAALLGSLKENTEAANKERATRGWPAYHITSWYRAPFYDVSTKNLTWAIQGFAEEQGKQEVSVNYSVRILGRHGTMNVDLVLDPSLVQNVTPKFNSLLSGFSFLPGSTYAEFRPGDKVAKYGLATLIAGGATALAVKTGLLAKLWKLIVALIAAFIAFLKRAWNYLKRIFAGKASDETDQNAENSPQHG